MCELLHLYKHGGMGSKPLEKKTKRERYAGFNQGNSKYARWNEIKTLYNKVIQVSPK